MIVGSESDTEITVTLPEAVRVREGGVSYNISLNALEVYQLQASSSLQDVTGAVITSTKPVSVFSGHQCDFVPAGITACVHLIEQLIPTNSWGREFFTLPLQTRQNGDTFRILADQDDTLVINPATNQAACLIFNDVK